MPYVIDRARALRLSDLVAIVPVRQRRLRSRVILRDNSLYHTLTRPKTLRAQIATGAAGLTWTGRRARRSGRGGHKE